jgi:hypothetical protein
MDLIPAATQVSWEKSVTTVEASYLAETVTLHKCAHLAGGLEGHQFILLSAAHPRLKRSWIAVVYKSWFVNSENNTNAQTPPTQPPATHPSTD